LASEAIRPQAAVTPSGVKWIRDGASGIDAAANTVTLASGDAVTYGHLVVCPFTASRSTVVFAEFDDQYQPMPSIPKVPTWKESRASWVVDRDIFPKVYWNLILKGRA
jgi:sulfide:quinone oxidoreductase